MRFMLVLLAVVLIASYVEAAPLAARCEYGRVQGFVAIKADPEYLVGTIPSRLTNNFRFFSRRYNCRGGGIQVRRVDLGIYDVKMVGLPRRVAFATAISQEGVSVSVQPFEDDLYRVALRGPLTLNGALLRRDVAFSLAVY